MATVYDVASYILNKKGSLPVMKLHKLLYYAQAWTLAWYKEPLFIEPIEAWINSPVVPSLYEYHKGQYIIHEIPGNVNNLTTNQKDSINKVLDFYSDNSSQWLKDAIHMEEPWIEARKGLHLSQRGNHEITHTVMINYYGSL